MTDRGASACPRNEHAVGWALRSLEPDEELTMRAHVAYCASCQATVRDTELVMGACGGSLDPVDPPVRLRNNLLAAAAATPQLRREESSETPHAATPDTVRRNEANRRGGRIVLGGRRLVAAGVVAAALVGVGGVSTYTARLQEQRAAETAQVQRLAEIIVRSKQPGSENVTLAAEGKPVAAVMVVDGHRTVVSSGLPPNPYATTYVLWGVGGAAPQPIAPFDVADPAPAPRWSGDAVGDFVGYAISLEAGRTMPAAPTSIVAIGQER